MIFLITFLDTRERFNLQALPSSCEPHRSCWNGLSWDKKQSRANWASLGNEIFKNGKTKCVYIDTNLKLKKIKENQTWITQHESFMVVADITLNRYWVWDIPNFSECWGTRKITGMGTKLTPANSLDNNLQLGAGGVLSVLVSNLDPTEQYSAVQFVYNVQRTSTTCTMADLVQTLVVLSPARCLPPRLITKNKIMVLKIYHRRRQQARQKN